MSMRSPYLHSHWSVLLLDIMIVLVHVQHNYSIGQCEGRITVHKRLIHAFLEGPRKTQMHT